jgi:hypothetical protein
MTKLTGLAATVALAATAAHGGVIGVNLGSATAEPNWNNLGTTTADLANLTYLDGGASGYSLTTDDTTRFNGVNTNGTTAPTTPASNYFPGTVSNSSFFGNTATFGGAVAPLAILTLGNLNPSATYQFTFYASRTGVGDNRETEYKVIGGTTETVFLDAANNTGNVAQTSFLSPDAGGSVRFEIQAGPNNTNANTQFYYLGGLHINEAIPEPGSLALLGAGGVLLLVRRRD